ncbi:MAG: polysaccharide pyruvyl transferase family protein [Anaerobutyricum hallii]|uniref:polysaccharide pyruvyl transferase family protein n=1 Tax=Anaerobutyricum hallii TaxID=39488 RepID=UPI002A7EF178|nr:polysaccharide pyruvyl transferase family protein [Anaerobutyricum hallii]MDY4576873.1 polysaccharide pyruvyl transferase family protein [Anaerobutyricum hallii]
MKVCILSMQRVPNFGSLLQGYSLKSMLEELGHEVCFIDIEENEEDDSLVKAYRKSFSGEYGTSNKKKIDKYIMNRILTKVKNKKQKRLMDQFQSEIINLDCNNSTEQYDCCVIGSDEVFNALNASEWGFTSQLFGNVPQAKNVITYAASSGFTNYEDLSQGAIDLIVESFKNISAFSVRDENTKQFVGKMTDKVIEMNYDPVIVGDFSTESKKQRIIKGLPQKYCIVYAYHNRINDKSEIQAIKKLCKDKGLTIVSVGASQFWINKHLVLNPFQIPYVFEHADFVVTDTFHGTIFASKYSSRFGILVRKSNENKLNDLIDKLQISDHRIECVTKMSQVYELKHDLMTMHEIEERERVRTLDYLKRYCR